jgi:heptosyltransferase-2
MIQRFAALAYGRTEDLPNQLPYPRLEATAHPENLLKKFSLQAERGIVVLCPGAEFGPSKQWPVAHYAEIAAKLISRGQQIVIMGSRKDANISAEICASLATNEKTWCTDLAGKTSLEEAIDLMSCAELVISNDSGLMHVAAALERPLVVIYGSTSPAFTPPLAEKVQIVTLELDCSPCFKRDCPLGHFNCMNNLAPEVVFQALEKLQENIDQPDRVALNQ